MNGREDKNSNDLFYTCSLIEYIARKTLNTPSEIVKSLGQENIDKIYDLAEVYHSDNIDDVADSFIDRCHIAKGEFDNVSECEYSVPSYWDIGKVYKRLIKQVAEYKHISLTEALTDVYCSRISSLIEDYNSSFYYDNPNLIFETYNNNCIPFE
ncbi:MAG: hypothetical protein J6F31_01315 [Oscillospiraceae bacterium]|nr:hypothetical protein [Oscillospiraceae bacterium]